MSTFYFRVQYTRCKEMSESEKSGTICIYIVTCLSLFTEMADKVQIVVDLVNTHLIMSPEG